MENARTQWNNLHRPSGLFMTKGQCPLCFIGEIGPHLPVNIDLPNIGPQLLVILDLRETFQRAFR